MRTAVRVGGTSGRVLLALSLSVSSAPLLRSLESVLWVAGDALLTLGAGHLEQSKSLALEPLPNGAVPHNSYHRQDQRAVMVRTCQQEEPQDSKPWLGADSGRGRHL